MVEKKFTCMLARLVSWLENRKISTLHLKTMLISWLNSKSFCELDASQNCSSSFERVRSKSDLRECILLLQERVCNCYLLVVLGLFHFVKILL